MLNVPACRSDPAFRWCRGHWVKVSTRMYPSTQEQREVIEHVMYCVP